MINFKRPYALLRSMKGRLTAIVLASAMLAGCAAGSGRNQVDTPQPLTPCEREGDRIVYNASLWDGPRRQYRVQVAIGVDQECVREYVGERINQPVTLELENRAYYLGFVIPLDP